MSQLRQHQKQLDRWGVQVCVVTFDPAPRAVAYVRETRLAWPILVDQQRTLYKAYGMKQGSAWNLFGPPAIWAYLKLLVRGRPLRRPGTDVRQLGGDVLIDPDGIVRLHYVGVGPADRPALSVLFAPLEEA